MGTLRDLQLCLKEKIEELRQRDQLIDELESELDEKDALIKKLQIELDKYKSVLKPVTAPIKQNGTASPSRIKRTGMSAEPSNFNSLLASHTIKTIPKSAV